MTAGANIEDRAGVIFVLRTGRSGQAYYSLTSVQHGANVLVTDAASSSSVLLLNVQASQLSDSDFYF